MDECTCGRIAIGAEVTEHRNWSPNCSEHGTDSAWWSSPEQRAERAARRAESLELQARAREAGRRNPPPWARVDT